MNPLSWFRCAAATPSWIEPAVLATRLERDDPCLFSTCGVLTNSPAPSDISEGQRTSRSSNCRRIFPLWFLKTGLLSWSVKPTADLHGSTAAPGGRAVGCFGLARRDGTVASARLTGKLRSG